MTYIIRIDAFGQGNFQLRFVGDQQPSNSFKVAPGDLIRFVAYRNNRKIDYQIVFKSPLRSPFTDIDRIDMPQGGLTEAFAVTTVLAGGMPFSIQVPSLGWHADPEILVEGATVDPALLGILEQLEKMIDGKLLHHPAPRTNNTVTVQVNNAGVFTFSGADPLTVHSGDTIAWTLTQDGVDAPNFSINFTAGSPPPSPLDNMENGIGPDYWDAKTAFVSSRIFRKLLASEGASKNFTYSITMLTGNMPSSPPRTVTLS